MPTSKPRTTVRRARRRDAAALTRIAHAAKRHWGYPEELLRLWRADLTVTPECIADQPTFCALRGGRIVGFYALSGQAALWELEHMWVHPRHIGHGIGRLLFAHMLEQLEALGAERLEIAADPNAEGFYRRMGARRVGKVRSRPRTRFLPLLEIRLRRRSGVAMK